MSVGHRSHLLEGGSAIQMAFTKRRRAPRIQEPVAPHQMVWLLCPQLARAMAMLKSWVFTPSMAISRL
jgi:hypothetical protein